MLTFPLFNFLNSDKNHGGDRPVGSLKPEGERGQNSSHIRALSDGHNIDTSSAGEYRYFVIMGGPSRFNCFKFSFFKFVIFS